MPHISERIYMYSRVKRYLREYVTKDYIQK
jgi:hypothetical protein